MYSGLGIILSKNNMISLDNEIIHIHVYYQTKYVDEGTWIIVKANGKIIIKITRHRSTQALGILQWS